jgi:hypothetical protein
MRKIINTILFIFMFAKLNGHNPIIGQIALNQNAPVSWSIKELNAKTAEMMKLIADRYQAFKVDIKNDLDKDISISLNNYFYGFCRTNLLKDNVLSPYSDIPGKTSFRKLIFNGPFWANIVFWALLYTFVLTNDPPEGMAHLMLIPVGFSLVATTTWSLLGWTFSLRKYNKLNKQYNLLNSCEPEIKLDRKFFNTKEPQIVGDAVIIPAKSTLTDYLFIPIAYPINFEGAVLNYTVHAF